MVDSASANFRLLANSPALNVGRDMSDFGLKADFDGNPRPLQSIYDVGAFEINAGTVNQPPTANAGSNISIILPTSGVTLNGSASKPAPGSSIAKVEWTKVSGPAVGTILTPTANQTQVTGLTIAGAYVYKLTVTDKNGLSASANVTITVIAANIPPTANTGGSQTIVLPANTVNVDGSKSQDTDGEIVTWLWKKVTGPAGGTISNPNMAATQIAQLQEGTYSFSLTVTDDKGATATATLTITVKPPANVPPTAYAGGSQTIVLPTSTVILNGGKSTDPDGEIISWLWQKVSGPAGGFISTPSMQATQLTQLQEGIYVYSLTVTDDKGAKATANVNIIVQPALVDEPNLPPVAVTRGDQTIQLPQNIVFADGSLSYDSDGSILKYEWLQLSGPSQATIAGSAQPQTYLQSLKEGVYQFKLTVTDNKQQVGVTTFTVTVLPPVIDHVGDTVILFPNPASRFIRLKIARSGSEILFLNVYDVSGKQVYNNKYSDIGSFQVEFPVNRLENGVYFIRLQDYNKHFNWKGRFLKVSE
jgi:hypothetical protein